MPSTTLEGVPALSSDPNAIYEHAARTHLHDDGLQDEEKQPSYNGSEQKAPGDYRTNTSDYVDEKHHDSTWSNGDNASLLEVPYDLKSGVPLPEIEGAEPELHQLTVRALVVGCLLGCIVQASNLYVGLKTGFTFGPQLFGAILGFAILKPLSRILPTWGGGGYFGPKENVTVQTAATAAGGLGILFVSGIPAMYSLKLLGNSPKDDFWRLISFTAVSAFYGLFFAIPLRKYYILRQKLIFPTPSATAVTIRSFHGGGKKGEAIAKKKFISLLIAFTGSITLRVVSEYAPGIMWDWHIFYAFFKAGGTHAIGIDNWGWFVELTPAFFGAGILTGVNASVSLLVGLILAWGIIGPSLVATGQAFGVHAFPDTYPEIMSYYSMSLKDPVNHPSPRYWLLWVGVLMMICASFTEIGCNTPSLLRGLGLVVGDVRHKINTRLGRTTEIREETKDLDETLPEDRVPTWAWVSGLLLTIILTCVVLGVQYHMNVGIAILSIILGFLFSLIGVQSAGDTDINPISTCAKAAQLVLGGATHGKYALVSSAQRINLLGGLVAGAAAAQTTDMTGDLKTGHLLRARPVVQFVAQGVGAICSIFLSVGLFVLFTTAYPCIIDIDAETCQFAAPSVGAWRAVAIAVTSEHGLPIPRSSWITAVCLGILSSLVIIVRHNWIPQKYWVWVPNMNAIGLGFVIYQVQYGIAMTVAAVIFHYYKKRNPVGYDLYAFSIAAGMMAGEGLGGTLGALFTVVGIDGSIYGTSIGCPGESYCG